jgi:hypothetical protein
VYPATLGAPRGTLDLDASKEALNRAYVRAVAAAARCMTSTPEPDYDKVDLTIRQNADHLKFNRAVLDVQLKATAQKVLKEDHIAFSLKQSDYNALCNTKCWNPRILVVFLVPESPDRWVYQHERAMLTRHCAYWYSLRGEPETAQASKTVHVPRSQVFDVDGLCRLLQIIGDGGFP